MTIEEIEAACDAGKKLDFSRHTLEGPELCLVRQFYPMGFPTEVRTNSAKVIALFEAAWGKHPQRYVTEVVRVKVQVVESTQSQCPPTPSYHMMRPVMTCIADAENHSVIDFDRNTTLITLTTAALNHPLYVRYFFIDASAACHIATRCAVPIHGGCVSLHGRGVLLCGDSGAGKSSLSYACARAGFTYTSDDGSYLVQGEEAQQVIGDCQRVRLRPASAAMFPEIVGVGLTPRAVGKPTIDLEPANLTGIHCSPTASIRAIVFLNRRDGDTHELRPYNPDVARYAMRQMVFSTGSAMTRQYDQIERLLKVGVFELRYTKMDWAVHRLERLLSEGG